ncbi:MAG: aspartate kinase [Sutterella sp.]|mgnify:FL=1|nr:aspartate kinase [Sutterella sp.]
MSTIVQKYGGTSMGSTDRIKNVARRVAKWHRAGHRMVVVVSAMSGETNRLIALAKEIMPNPDPRELDVIASTGEQVSIGLLAMALKAIGIEAVSYNGTQVGMHTDSAYTKARIESIDAGPIKSALDAGKVVIVAGFQGQDSEGNVTTLGRGGSDTSAVALAVALHADECLIYTDVDGVYTTDPRIEPKARRLRVVSSEEMLELASLGSKVLQTRSVEFADKYKMPIRVLSSLTDPDMPLSEEENSGTLITVNENQTMEKPLISGIAFTKAEAKITLIKVPNIPGVAYKILGPIEHHNIDIDMIVQNVGLDGTTDFSFLLPRSDLDNVLKIIREEIYPQTGELDVHTSTSVAKVSVVGVGMRTHANVASTAFEALAKEGINILMIGTSEIKLSVVIEDKYMELAVRALHEAFGLDK